MKTIFGAILSFFLFTQCGFLPDDSTDSADLQNILLIILAQRQNQPSASIPSAELTGEALEFHKLINEHRVSVGCPVLEEYPKLSGVALAHSRDMKNKNYFSHTSQDGTTFDRRIRNAGIQYDSAAENIARGQRTGQAVFTAWINSDGHKRNIENCRLTHHGLGYEADGHYWTNKFVRNPRTN